MFNGVGHFRDDFGGVYSNIAPGGRKGIKIGEEWLIYIIHARNTYTHTPGVATPPPRILLEHLSCCFPHLTIAEGYQVKCKH